MSRSLDSVRADAERCEDLQRQLKLAQEEVRAHRDNRSKLTGEIDNLTAKLKDDVLHSGNRIAELEATLADRNHEIKFLMYRVQELSSKYTPLRGDAIDAV